MEIGNVQLGRDGRMGSAINIYVVCFLRNCILVSDPPPSSGVPDNSTFSTNTFFILIALQPTRLNEAWRNLWTIEVKSKKEHFGTFYWTQVNLGSDSWVWMSIRQSETATYASGAIWWSKLQLMQVTPSDGQIFNLCKWRHLVGKFATSANGAIWWPNLWLMQVVLCCC